MDKYPDQAGDAAARAQCREQAAAYVSQPREQVLKAYPQLQPAYAAEDHLRAEAARAQPIAPAVGTLIDGVIRSSVAGAIRKGVEPKVTSATTEALRLEVALRNLDHVVGARALDASSTLALSAAHRSLLVATAADSFKNPKGIPDFDPVRAAHLLGQTDAPQQADPFEEKMLSDAYAAGQRPTVGPGRGASGPDFSR